jgi:hypothetical protein
MGVARIRDKWYTSVILSVPAKHLAWRLEARSFASTLRMTIGGPVIVPEGTAGWSGGEFRRQVETMNGVEEEERADALVEIVALAAEAVELVALGKQLLDRCRAAESFERQVADAGFRREDNLY